MRTRWIIVCFAAVLALVAGGCSSDSDDKADTSDRVETTKPAKKSGSGGGSSKVPSDICELLTVEDAQAAVGGAALELDEGLRDDACDYSGFDADDNGVSVSLIYEANGLEDFGAKDVSELVDRMADEEFGVTKVDGVGDAAYAFQVISLDTLFVANGDDSMTITIIGGPDDKADAMTTLAKTALAKL